MKYLFIFTLFFPGFILLTPKERQSQSNEFATLVGTEHIESNKTRKFVSAIAPTCIRFAHETGYQPSTFISLAIVESGSGNSTLASLTNNIISRKCYEKSHNHHAKAVKLTKKGQRGVILPNCVQFYDDKPTDFFVKYETRWEAIKELSILLNGPRYGKCAECKTTEAEIECIKKRGYATDKRWVSKLTGTINKNELKRFNETFRSAK